MRDMTCICINICVFYIYIRTTHGSTEVTQNTGMGMYINRHTQTPHGQEKQFFLEGGTVGEDGKSGCVVCCDVMWCWCRCCGLESGGCIFVFVATKRQNMKSGKSDDEHFK